MIAKPVTEGEKKKEKQPEDKKREMKIINIHPCCCHKKGENKKNVLHWSGTALVIIMLVLLMPALCLAQDDKTDHQRYARRANDERVVVYDCSEPTQVQDRALDQGTLTCKEDTTIVKHSVNTTYQLLVKEKKQRIKGYRCEVLDTRSVSWCGQYSHTGTWDQMNYFDHPKPPTVSNCRRMVRDKKYKLPDSRVSELAMNTIVHEFYDEVGNSKPTGPSFGSLTDKISCQGATWVYQGKTYPDMLVNHNLKIKITTEEFIWDGETLIATSDNTRLPCSSLDQDCQTPEATYIWNGDVQYCPMAVTRTTTGVVVTDERQREVFMSTDGSLVRVIISHQEVACGRMVQATNYPDLFLAEEDHTMPFRRKVDPMSVSMTTYVNNRDDFLYNHMVSQINVELNAVLQHNCEEHRRTTRESFYIKHTNPGIITYGFGNGTYATSAGEVIYYHTCRREIAKAKALDVCYDALPVDLDPESPLRKKFNMSTQWFMEPLTKRLTRYASVIPCTRHFAPKYQTYLNKWISATPEIHFTERPRPMAQPEQVVVQMQANVDFSSGGVFDEKDMKAWEAFAFIGRIRDSVASQLALQVSDSYNRGSTDTTFQTPDAWLMAKYHGLLAILSGYGQFAAIMVSLVCIWRCFTMLFQWLYGGCQIYKDVNSCTMDIVWALCPTMFLLKERREERREIRDSPIWGDVKANFRRFLGMDTNNTKVEAASDEEEELHSPPPKRSKRGYRRQSEQEDIELRRTEPPRRRAEGDRRRSMPAAGPTTPRPKPRRPDSFHYPDLPDIDEHVGLDPVTLERRMQELRELEELYAQNLEQHRRPPSAASTATAPPPPPPNE